MPAAKAIEEQHAAWTAKLLRDPDRLWDALLELDREQTLAPLFAHCASLTVNAVRQAHDPRTQQPRHADQLAATLALDMSDAGWMTTAANYFSRITKAHILDAAREAKGQSAANLIDSQEGRYGERGGAPRCRNRLATGAPADTGHRRRCPAPC